MKKLALPIATFSVLLAGAASAADIRMPVKAPPPAPVAVYSWTGCYIGAGGGYGMFDQEAQFVASGVPQGLSNDVGGRGWFGTVQVGCDYQVGSNIVVGAFGDYDFSGIKGDWALASTLTLAGLIGEEKHKSSWAAGGRIGWIPFQAAQLLVYVSGGYTQARFDAFNLVVVNAGQPTALSIDKHTYSGWFIGTGYEYGLSFLPGLFWKTEYRFADYGKERASVLASGLPFGNSVDQHKYMHTVRSELVWRFNAGGAASTAEIRGPMPVKAPAPVVVYRWTGCYLGAGGGYGMFNQEVGYVDNGVPLGLSNDVGGRGWFGTVQAGCDYQVAPNIVIGASADYDFSGIKGDWASAIFAVFVGEEQHKSTWAAGGRIGWVPFQASQLLVYLSGGYTEARFDRFNLVRSDIIAPTNVSVDKHTYSGWYIGAGYEYGLGFLPGLFWKTEYRFADYGKERVAIFNFGILDADSLDHHKRFHTVRSELVWRFNFGGPVVARY